MFPATSFGGACTRALSLASALTTALAAGQAAAAPPPSGPPMVAVAATRLAAVDNAHCSNPRPSPDGRWVAYVVDELKDVRRQMVYQRETKETRRLQPVLDTSAVRRKLASGATSGQVCHELAWVPSSPPGAVMSCNNGEGNYDLYFVEGTARLERPAFRITRSEANDFGPSVARVGEAMRVVYVSGRSGDGDLYGLSLPVTATLDDDAQRLTSVAGAPELSPAFAPGGQRFLYVRQTARGEDDIHAQPADGGESGGRVLAKLPGSELNAGFSPDGQRVAFYSNARDRKFFDLYLTDDAGAPRRLVDDAVRPEQAPAAFTPDGQGLIYIRHQDPTNPIEIVYPGDPTQADPEAAADKIVRLDTQTVQNKDAAVVALPDGRWYLAFAAQAAVDDRQKRWDRIYGATLDPQALRAAARPIAPPGRKKGAARK